LSQQSSPLLSARGRELLLRLGTGVERPMRVAEQLRGSYPPDLIAAVLTQVALRAEARDKFSRADEMLFTRAGLEQASSDLTAGHAGARYAGARLIADLCCGIGGSLTALAAVADVLAVDHDLSSLQFARHNAAVCGAPHRVGVVCADVRDVPLAGLSHAGRSRARLGRAGPSGAGPGTTEPRAAGRHARPVDAVFIDPARRSAGRRLLGGRSDPPLSWCLDLAERVPSVGIKTAPGLPHELVPPGWEIEFVAVGRGLKEALLWSPALATTSRRATVLQAAGHSLTGRQTLTAGDPPTAGDTPTTGDTLTAAGPLAATAAPVPVAAPGGYLLDPNPAVTRAGLVEQLARQLGAWKIDPMIAFLSADSPLRSPFGRTLRVLESAPWQEKAFARRLRELGIGTADIRRRGLAGDVGQIRRRLGLHGPGTAVIVMTRMNGRPWGLICTAPDDG
jgi:SAM-dependent methyltransferase